MDGGGIGEVVIRDSDSDDSEVLEEVILIKDVDIAGNASAGIVIDRDRNRLLVAIGDMVGNKYSALAAYDLSTWHRIFLTELSGHTLSSLHLDGSLTWSLLTALFITQTGSSSLSTLFSALLYKIDLTEGDQSNKVNVIEVTGGTLRFGDGIELLSPTKIVIAGSNPSTRLVESSDKWRTASVTGLFRSGMFHRLVSAATVKEGRIYLTHIVGFGSKK
ncbi:hypothetical protein Bca52824_058490 [Brassica carinata]|uniref:Uncharacterized protein n=1 Tax=Brassica carinata TaxID=52824 RepID=A0A8X7QWE1_BRACI|nr:hypothetical protein Bca52824_058490 [Brassica carinata]